MSSAQKALGLGLLVCSLTASACGGGGGGGGPPTVSATIGAMGGIVEGMDPGPLLGVQLEIPPGALGADTQVAIVAIAPGRAPGGFQPTGVIVDLQPSGLQFLEPARLRLPVDDEDLDGLLDGSGRPVHEAACVSLAEGATEWRSLPLDAHGDGFVETSISHFSHYTTTTAPRLRGPEVRIWYDPAADPTPITNSSNHAQVKACILAAMGIPSGSLVGPWNQLLTDPPPAAGWTIATTNNEAEADVRIRWTLMPPRLSPQTGQPTLDNAATFFSIPVTADECSRVLFDIEFNQRNDDSTPFSFPGTLSFVPFRFHFHPSLDGAPGSANCGNGGVPANEIDLFSTAAHELAHALGLSGDCLAGCTPACPCPQLNQAPTACSVVEGTGGPGDATRTHEPPDRAFLLQYNPFVYRGFAPTGTIPKPSGMMDLEITVRSLTDASAIDESSARLTLSSPSLRSLPPLFPVALNPGPGTQRTFVFSTDARGLPAEKICARLDLGDQGTPPVSDSFAWDFTLGVAPKAEFTASPRSGRAPLTVRFTDRSTGTIEGWLWSFGDGSSSVERSPSHQYVDAGTYNVSLTVTGAVGSDSETKTAFVTVSEGPPPPPTCDSGVDLVVTEVGGGEFLHIAWCTANDVIARGGRFWTLQAKTGGFCGWQTLFEAEERSFADTLRNGLGSSFCLRVVVTANSPPEPDCIPGILASDRDGTDCN